MIDDRIRIRVGIVRGIDFGRIDVRTGVTDRDVLDQIYTFVSERIKAEDDVTLRQIRDHGKQGLVRAFNEAITGTKNSRPLGSSEPLADALKRWIESHPVDRNRKPLAATTVESYRQAVVALLKLADSGATVYALPDVLNRYLIECEKRQMNLVFRRARTMCRSFARSAGDEWLLSKLQAAPNMDAERKRERRTLDPKEVQAIMAKMREQGNGHFSQHVWNLACTAMRPKEYAQLDMHTPVVYEWHDDAIRVLKGKNPRAKRFIPRLDGVGPAPNVLCKRTAKMGRVTPEKAGTQKYYSLSTIAKAFKLACGEEDYEIYDLRASTQKWWEWAGISSRASILFAGHTRSTSVNYKTNGPHKRDWQRDLDDANEKMRAWFITEGINITDWDGEVARLEESIAALTKDLQHARKMLLQSAAL
ncbi:hypothetical protein [Gemmatimonas groenlandica]|uniref:Uncharacterized protein n=1 Tax=Gemmatimonas groenlandica TaxID=2732249 RepID=A0A6M4IKG7_9BACT|nr:hypothetical protein [Gemmatimonas groenlandica]QJR35233.1 hypothetical protein HKW67_06810 [Gemmatimonas groenlandica]